MRARLGPDQYQRIVEATREGLWVLDGEARTTFANPRVAELLGCQPADLLGRSLFACLDPDDHSRAEHAFHARQSDPFDVRLRRGDGGLVWVQVALSPFVEPPGTGCSVLATLTDISERKQVEAELRASERRVRRLIESNIIGITIGDLEGRILDANDALLRLIGYTQDDLRQGRVRWDTLTPPEQMPLDERAIAEAQRLGAATPWEKEYIRKDGTRVPVLIGFALLDESLGTTVAFILDLSESKRAENRQRMLAEASRAFSATRLQLGRLLDIVVRTVAEQMGQGGVLYLVSDDGSSMEPVSVYDADPAAQAMARALLADAPYRSDATLGEPELWPVVERLGVHSLAAVPVRVQAEVAGVLAVWRRGADGQPFTEQDHGLLEDLAERAGLAIDNARQYQRTEAAVRVRDEVLGAVSHDLKNPVGAIKAQAQLLVRRVERGRLEPASMIEGMRRIDLAATRMSGWIEELLDVARLQTGHELELSRSATDLVELARQVVADHQATTRQHTLRVCSAVERLVGSYDAPRVRRVLDNLLSNAVKYSEANTEIEVQIEEAHEPSGAWAVLRVVDQGIGIPAPDLPHVFDRFHRGRNVAGRIVGTGIGLAGAARIVAQHGGRIDVASQEGQGSTFTVRLPLTRLSAAQPED